MTRSRPGAPEQTECCDCGRWAHAGEQIRHSSRCDTPNAQPPRTASEAKTAAIVRDAKAGVVYVRHSEQDVVDAVRTGRLSMSDAMNQDG